MWPDMRHMILDYLNTYNEDINNSDLAKHSLCHSIESFIHLFPDMIKSDTYGMMLASIKCDTNEGFLECLAVLDKYKAAYWII